MHCRQNIFSLKLALLGTDEFCMYMTFSPLIISLNLDKVHVSIFTTDPDKANRKTGGGANK